MTNPGIALTERREQMKTYSFYFEHKRIDIKASTMLSAFGQYCVAENLQDHGSLIAVIETAKADEDYLNFAFHLKED